MVPTGYRGAKLTCLVAVDDVHLCQCMCPVQSMLRRRMPVNTFQGILCPIHINAASSWDNDLQSAALPY